MNASSTAPPRPRGPLLLVLAALLAGRVEAAPARAPGAQAGGAPQAGAAGDEDGQAAGQDADASEGRRRRKRNKQSPFFEALRATRFPNIPRPPLATAWKDPKALERGERMKRELMDAAGGWDAFREADGVRYDLLVATKLDPKKPGETWRVHHYVATLAHFDAERNGYLYSEYAKPSLTGPDFVREVVYDEYFWREMRGGYLRTPNARRTAYSAVRLEQLCGLMPFCLEMLGGKLAYLRDEEVEGRPIEVYALQLDETLVLNTYPILVDEYGYVDEYFVYVDPGARPSDDGLDAGPADAVVVQLRWAVPDDRVKEPPHMGWWTIDYEGLVDVGDKLKLPHRRYRWLDDWGAIEEYEIADGQLASIPAPAMRRPWQTDIVYQMPYRCDFWDPPAGVTGLAGHDTDTPLPRAGTYPPNHPKSRPTGKFPPLEGEGSSGSTGSDGEEGDSPR